MVGREKGLKDIGAGEKDAAKEGVRSEPWKRMRMKRELDLEALLSEKTGWVEGAHSQVDWAISTARRGRATPYKRLGGPAHEGNDGEPMTRAPPGLDQGGGMPSSGLPRRYLASTQAQALQRAIHQQSALAGLWIGPARLC